jgi:hypothetical protein
MVLDDLVGKMHKDDVQTIEEQLRNIERDILLRRLASVGMQATLIKHIEELTNQILRLQPENDGVPDLNRQERAHLERERRELQLRVHEEERNLLKDNQPLRQEGRQATRERTEEAQDYAWMTDLYDPRPQ